LVLLLLLLLVVFYIIIIVIVIVIVVVLLLFIIYTINLPVVQPLSCRIIYHFDTPILEKRHQSFDRVNYLNFVINVLFIYCNNINSYNFKNLEDNINNIYCLVTHSWPNLKSFDYKMNNFSRGSKHMQVLSQTHYVLQVTVFHYRILIYYSLLYLIYKVY